MEGITESGNPLQGGNNLLGVKISGKNFKETRIGLNRLTKDDAEARNDFWSMEGDFVYRRHIEPRVQLHVPKEDTFPIPLNYIDVTRATYTNLDVMQESRSDDCWNLDVDRRLSESWTGFTKFTLLNEKLPKGCMSSGGRLTQIQATTRPDYLWLGLCSGILKAAQKMEKQEWAIEKPKTRQRSWTERHVFHRSGRWRV